MEDWLGRRKIFFKLSPRRLWPLLYWYLSASVGVDVHLPKNPTDVASLLKCLHNYEVQEGETVRIFKLQADAHVGLKTPGVTFKGTKLFPPHSTNVSFLLYLIGIYASIAAIVGIGINLCIFLYEMFVGRTISCFPIVPSVSLMVALLCLGLVSWYWAILIGVAHFAFELSMLYLLSAYGKDARTKKNV